jgi:hypothetical protein
LAKSGYIVFHVRARVRWGRDDLPLDDLDGNGTALANLLENTLRDLKGEIQTEARYEQAFRIDSFDGDRGYLFVEAVAGPYGVRGALLHTKTGSEQEYTEDHATVRPLRAMFALPRQGFTGLLFCERYAGRHLKNSLEKGVLVSALRTCLPEHNVKLSAYVDHSAWAAFLEQSAIYRVTSVFRAKQIEQIGDDRRRPADLKIMAEGPLATKIGRKIVDNLRNRFNTVGEPAAINIDEELTELKPRNESEYERERLEVQVGDENDKRTIVVEREQMPQFVYQLGADGKKRVETSLLKQVWRDHADKILAS